MGIPVDAQVLGIIEKYEQDRFSRGAGLTNREPSFEFKEFQDKTDWGSKILFCMSKSFLYIDQPAAFSIFPSDIYDGQYNLYALSAFVGCSAPH